MNPRFAAVLLVVNLLGSVPLPAFAAKATGTPAADAVSTESARSANPVPEAAWSLGIAVVGVALVLRRKAV
jgi:hypothetical protein